MILLKQKYNSSSGLKINLIFVLFMSLILLFGACEPWNETSEVSHLSYLPEFEIIGDEYQSYVVVDSAEYDDAGALAHSNGEPLKVYSYGEVDLTEVGVYTIVYYAENSDRISTTAERIIAVTNNDISSNDLSGKYESYSFSNLPSEMKVSKLETAGFYKCDDVLGYPGIKVDGKFVDLGNHELILIHGDSEFGRYSDAEGEYTLSALFWMVVLIDSPYNGLELSVFWSRVVD